jgi:hypothetical protein
VSALRSIALAVLLVASTAAAQSYEDARRALDLSPDPLARSPRLLGMGRLTLTVDDAHNRITLWDFAGNPIGILDADTVSSFELRPATAAASSAHNVVRPPDITLERQDLAAREIKLGYEAWHRTPGKSAYGAIGDLGTLRVDRPYSDGIERRSSFTVPSGMPILAFRMPFMADRMRYGFRLILDDQSSEDRYRQITRNAAGEFIDQGGDILSPPDFFTPDQYSVRTMGGGLALGYRFGEPVNAAIAYDRVGLRIKGRNTGSRYDSETRETRPYDRVQGSLVGRFGRSFSWGVDARTWQAVSKEFWVFTISAGPAAVPLTGRGKLLDRREDGSSLRSRVGMAAGRFDLGASFDYRRQRIKIKAPRLDDRTSFNAFRNTMFDRRAASDTLVMPDSLVSNTFEERGWEAAGGVSWRLPGKRGVVGAEYHRARQELEQAIAGLGPRRVTWDFRGGIEYPLNPVLVIRGGYIHRWSDGDEFAEQDEFLANSVTVGAGLRPGGSRWTMETGYAMEWSRADYGDPGLPRANRHQLALQLQWIF